MFIDLETRDLWLADSRRVVSMQRCDVRNFRGHSRAQGRLVIFLKQGDMRIDVGERLVYIARTMKLGGTFICFAYSASLN